jgi:hypothetical protein
MMQRIFIPLILSVILGFSTRAQQSNLVIFTQENQPFTVILNGIQQSPDPVTNVRITGLGAPNYKVRIIFDNKGLPEINKTIYLQPETEVTCEVLKNKKGQWVIRMLNSTPVDEIPEPVTNQVVFVYSPTPRLSSTTVSQTTTINNIGITGSTSYTTTTTQTTSTVSGEAPPPGYEYGDVDDRDRHEHPEYTGPKGCQRPMNRHSFEQALESINSKSFESSKLTVAKQVAGANCLLCQQVKEIMKLFSFESDRLEFAKFAYKYTWDLNNYYLLNDAFEFESSIGELNRYINGHKH